MISSTITAEPGSGSYSPGFCHVGEKGASLQGERTSDSSAFITFGGDSCSISCSFAYFDAALFSFIVQSASSIFVVSHSQLFSSLVAAPGAGLFCMY